MSYVPSEYSDEILEWIASGKTLRSYCRQEGKPCFRVVYDWLAADDDLHTRFTRAREIGADAIADECLQIADTQQAGETTRTTANGVEVTTEDMLGHRRLQIDTRLRLLAKWWPQRYGDKQQVEHTGRLTLEELIAGGNE